MATAIQWCDRCKNFCSQKDGMFSDIKYIHTFSTTDKFCEGGRAYDLCPDCSMKLHNWLTKEYATLDE